MAILEKNILLSKKESNGDRTLLYPITKAECVDGLDEIIEELNNKINNKSLIKLVIWETDD